MLAGARGGQVSAEADLPGQRSDGAASSATLCPHLKQQHSSQEGVAPEPHLLHTLTDTLSLNCIIVLFVYCDLKWEEFTCYDKKVAPVLFNTQS